MTYYISPKVTDWQKQVIMGTILGGSSVIKPKGGRNAYLSMRGKDPYWLEYKSHELKNLASPTPFLLENDQKYFRWHSLCYPEFNDYRTLFYQDGKKVVSMEALNQLRDIGLAIWFLDAGRLDEGKVIFNTQVFKEEGTKTICKYFNEISIAAETFVTAEPPRFRVIIKKESKEKFFKVIKARVPSFMAHCLLE